MSFCRDCAVRVTAATEPQGGVPLWRTRPIWAAGTTAVLAAGDPLPLALHPPDCPYRQLGLNALDAAHRPVRRRRQHRAGSSVEQLGQRVLEQRQ